MKKSIAIVSLRFSPAHTSHLFAYGRLAHELGLEVTFILEEQYLGRANFAGCGQVIPITKHGRLGEFPACDYAVFYNAAFRNARLAKHMRRRGTGVLYVFHEPVAITKRLVLGWKGIAPLAVAKMLSINMIRHSSAVLVPSEMALAMYRKYYSKYNRCVFLLPLLLDDEPVQDGARFRKRPRRYFSFLGNAMEIHDFNGYVAFAKYALRNGSSMEFAIATRDDLRDLLIRDEELRRYAQAGRIRIQHGRTLSNEEMNTFA